MLESSDFQTLNAERILETIVRLQRRIDERFPRGGLRNVCRQLQIVGEQARERSEWIRHPIVGLRILSAILAGVLIAILSFLLQRVALPSADLDLVQFAQLLESAVNDVVLLGAAIFFLVTIETRIKRARALRALHELRSLAHLIDIHQLTKDPQRLMGNFSGTASSPQSDVSAFELSRYLDYCSEMLSLIGKIAVLYVQDFDDSVVLASVNEVEQLAAGFSNKIWQKLIIIHTASDASAALSGQL